MHAWQPKPHVVNTQLLVKQHLVLMPALLSVWSRLRTQVVIKAGTCWGWDDFFGPEVYTEPTQWDKFMTEKKQLLLSCHLYSCQ